MSYLELNHLNVIGRNYITYVQCWVDHADEVTVGIVLQ